MRLPITPDWYVVSREVEGVSRKVPPLLQPRCRAPTWQASSFSCSRDSHHLCECHWCFSPRAVVVYLDLCQLSVAAADKCRKAGLEPSASCDEKLRKHRVWMSAPCVQQTGLKAEHSPDHTCVHGLPPPPLPPNQELDVVFCRPSSFQGPGATGVVPEYFHCFSLGAPGPSDTCTPVASLTAQQPLGVHAVWDPPSVLYRLATYSEFSRSEMQIVAPTLVFVIGSW